MLPMRAALIALGIIVECAQLHAFDEFTRKACGFTNDDVPFPEE